MGWLNEGIERQRGCMERQREEGLIAQAHVGWLNEDIERPRGCMERHAKVD